jgi:hypothetical protein
LPLCILCGSETTEVTIAHGSTLIICPNCQEYSLVEGLAAEFAKQPPEFRRDLARAVRWHFYRREPGEPPITLPDLNAAQFLVARKEEFDETRDDVGANALVNAGAVADPWHEPIVRLGRAVGMPNHEALVFAKDLETRGIVRIVPAYMSLQAPGEQSFGKFERWERSEGKNSTES